MQQSMTGFCHLSEVVGTKQILLDIKCLNSKSFDCNVRLPFLYKELEQDIRNLLSIHLIRGKIDLNINIEWLEQPVSSSINKTAFKTHFQVLNEIKEELNLSYYEPDWFSFILRMPDVVQTTTQQLSEEEKNAVLSIVLKGIEQVVQFRKYEGQTLMSDILNRIDAIEEGVKKIEPVEQQRIEAIKQRILNSLKEFQGESTLDKNRFEQELIYYLEKMDITEEKVRIRSHCKYFREVSIKEMFAGRKLHFIVQELAREINTLGSKAQDFNIQQQVIIMKDELEKIKEQLMNIL